MVVVGIVPAVLFLVVAVAVHLRNAAAAGRQHIVVTAGRRLRGGLPVTHHVVNSADAGSGRVPLHHIANLVVTPRLRREAADACRREL